MRMYTCKLDRTDVSISKTGQLMFLFRQCSFLLGFFLAPRVNQRVIRIVGRGRENGGVCQRWIEQVSCVCSADCSTCARIVRCARIERSRCCSRVRHSTSRWVDVSFWRPIMTVFWMCGTRWRRCDSRWFTRTNIASHASPCPQMAPLWALDPGMLPSRYGRDRYTTQVPHSSAGT